MLRHRILGAAVLALCLGPAASAQLNLTLTGSFVDTLAGGNGNIGVTQDEVVDNFYVVDFSNPVSGIHEFDPLGVFLSNFPTSGCSPSAPSPNDVVWDPDTDTLWIVDNSGSIVLNVSRTGTCLGGFNLISSPSNPVGIGYNRVSKTLFVSSTATVQEYDKLGNLLTGGFSFTPPVGSTILSSITWYPPTGNYLVASSSGDEFYEVSPTGALVSTTSVVSFGIGNIQGMHYNPKLNTLNIVDNTLSTVFIFSAGCVPGLPYGAGCAGLGGFVPSLKSGCAEVGQTVQVDIANGLGGALSAMLISGIQVSQPIGPTTCTLLVGSPNIVVIIPLGGAAGVAGAGSVTLPALIPLGTPLVTVYLQSYVADPAGPIGLSVSNGLAIQIQ